jgi:hypothetical protein
LHAFSLEVLVERFITEININAGLKHRTWQAKSPFEKGGFRGISGSYKNPP